MDGDRYPELLIAADFGTSRYLRNGGAGSHDGPGAFVDATDRRPRAPTARPTAMGSAIGDFDNDGLLDWYLTSVYADGGSVSKDNGNMLYVNQGGHRFRELSEAAGVNNGGWGWGAVAVDLDHDGRLDLVTTNGWEKPNPEGLLEWISEPSHCVPQPRRPQLPSRHLRGGLGAPQAGPRHAALRLRQRRRPGPAVRQPAGAGQPLPQRPVRPRDQLAAGVRRHERRAAPGAGRFRHPGGAAGGRPLAVPRHPRRQHLQRGARAVRPLRVGSRRGGRPAARHLGRRPQ